MAVESVVAEPQLPRDDERGITPIALTVFLGQATSSRSANDLH
jgi:hypothetical protein